MTTQQELIEWHSKVTSNGEYVSVSQEVRGKPDSLHSECKVWTSVGGIHTGETLEEAVEKHNKHMREREPNKLRSEAQMLREQAAKLEAEAKTLEQNDSNTPTSN